MTVKMSVRNFVFLGAVVLLSACRKDVNVAAPDAVEIPIEVAAPRVQAIMKEIADALEKVYENDKALMEVNAAIHSGYYHDERILVKDLLLPESSGVYLNHRFLNLTDTGV